MLLTDLLHVILASALGFLMAIAAIPPILKVAKIKHLFDTPNERKLHTQAIPPLGGIAIFIAFVLSVILSSHGLSFYPIRYIIAAILLMFFIGLKDDLITISPRKKFAVQIVSVLLLLILGNVEITNLHGLAGIHEIHPVIGFPLTIFLMIAIINAFNLIDGIDGLASGLAIMASFAFGLWFFMSGYLQYAIISFALTGSLAGFFLFNVFGNSNKLFMGDTGSLLVGMILAILVVRFNELNIHKTALYAIGAAPSVSFAIVMLPLIDTLRVMILRILSGRSPFSPDKNHIHHRLLELFPNHLTVTLIMVASNLVIIALALLLNNQLTNVSFQFLIIFTSSLLLAYLPTQLLKWRKQPERKVASYSNQTNFLITDKNLNIHNLKINGVAVKEKYLENH
jgi:UDP-GlcNAc:undecaprenyl-phosphate/decaprenyl-phosphate GlcNAc-1-phosphate transferase